MFIGGPLRQETLSLLGTALRALQARYPGSSKLLLEGRASAMPEKPDLLSLIGVLGDFRGEDFSISTKASAPTFPAQNLGSFCAAEARSWLFHHDSKEVHVPPGNVFYRVALGGLARRLAEARSKAKVIDKPSELLLPPFQGVREEELLLVLAEVPISWKRVANHGKTQRHVVEHFDRRLL